MDEVLYVVCRHNTNLSDGWHPISAKAIAEILNTSVGKVRYRLSKLKEKGLVHSCNEGGIAEDGTVFCHKGWNVTKEAFKTEEYKKAYAEERELCKECFGIDIGEQFKIDETE